MAKIFHKLLNIDEASKVLIDFYGKPLGVEEVDLSHALGRVLALNISAPIDIPPFDRSEKDGYAVSAESTYGADEDNPIELKVIGVSEVGELPKVQVGLGEAVEISTGAPIPRGANAVVPVEYTKSIKGRVIIYRSVSPGENVAQAGSDMRVGDVVLRKGTIIGHREIAVLAALGISKVPVYKRPRVAVISTGNEIVVPGRVLKPGKIYDINGFSISAMLKEMGAEPIYMGVVEDDYDKIKTVISKALETSDLVITSGSTSAGLGDIIYRVFEDLGGGELIFHGLRLKPGKPTVVGIINGKLVIGLPGFPTSAIMVFNIVVRPLIERMLGYSESRPIIKARIPFRVQGIRGMRRLIPVAIVGEPGNYRAYPLLGHSGSVHNLVVADGFITVPENRLYLDEGEEVDVVLFSQNVRLADLVIIGSHCPGLDLLIEMSDVKNVKVISVGSIGGWQSIARGEADIAGTHILDELTGEYNRHLMDRYKLRGKAFLIRGYSRLQGLLVQKGNPKGIKGFEDFFRDDVTIVNRNPGSGTRTLIDMKLREVSSKIGLKFEDAVRKIKGYNYVVKTHSAVAAAVAQGRADVGVAVKPVALAYGLDFIPISDEIYDLLVNAKSIEKRVVKSLIDTLKSEEFAKAIKSRLPGYKVLSNTGDILEK